MASNIRTLCDACGMAATAQKPLQEIRHKCRYECEAHAVQQVHTNCHTEFKGYKPLPDCDFCLRCFKDITEFYFLQKADQWNPSKLREKDQRILKGFQAKHFLYCQEVPEGRIALVSTKELTAAEFMEIVCGLVSLYNEESAVPREIHKKTKQEYPSIRAIGRQLKKPL